MKESYRESSASYSGLEPYAGDGNIAGVASARGNPAQPSCQLGQLGSVRPLLIMPGKTQRFVLQRGNFDLNSSTFAFSPNTPPRTTTNRISRKAAANAVAAAKCMAGAGFDGKRRGSSGSEKRDLQPNLSGRASAIRNTIATHHEPTCCKLLTLRCSFIHSGHTSPKRKRVNHLRPNPLACASGLYQIHSLALRACICRISSGGGGVQLGNLMCRLIWLPIAFFR